MSMSTSSASGRAFSWRAFTSLVVSFAFAVLALTGVALYATPPGRVANWSGWTLAGLTKANWQAVHMVFGFLFVAAGALHLFFNWKVLLNYLRSRTQSGIPRKRELAWALGAALSLVVLSIADVPPVSAVAIGRDRLANVWATSANEPPIPHAELLTVEKVATSLNMTAGQATERLKGAGFTASADVTLEHVAAQRGVTPQEVYRQLAQSATSPAAPLAPPVSGAGMGWKTVRQVATERGIPVETAQARLRAAGVDAGPDEALREIAKRGDRHAPELFSLITATER